MRKKIAKKLVNTAINAAKIASEVSTMLCELGAGTGLMLVGLGQIKRVANEHPFLKFWD